MLAGCGRGDEQVAATPPPPTGVRHELGPLASRFAQLGTPVSASWVTWNSSGIDDRVPGPSTYWLDAIVHLDPVTWLRLKTQYDPTDQGHRPDVQALLRSELSKGPFLTSAALDLAFTTPILASYAYLDAATNDLVLISTGG
jgi:hypothetical protein